jgi:hypothetical protein
MLVKISNDTKEFESKMNHLKVRLGLKVTSKVAEYCVENYANLDDQNKELMKQADRLENELVRVLDAVHKKVDADKELIDILKIR